MSCKQWRVVVVAVDVSDSHWRLLNSSTLDSESVSCFDCREDKELDASGESGSNRGAAAAPRGAYRVVFTSSAPGNLRSLDGIVRKGSSYARAMGRRLGLPWREFIAHSSNAALPDANQSEPFQPHTRVGRNLAALLRKV